jgi:Spy/CpxP family protein refolding chaperone
MKPSLSVGVFESAAESGNVRLRPFIEWEAMKANIKTIVFIASVALNVVFAVTYITYKIPSLPGVHQQSSRQPVFLELNLTPDQLTRFSAERDRFHALLQELSQEIKTRQIELIDLLGATPPDKKAVETKQEEIQRLQGIVQDGVIAHILQGSSLLSSEQRSRFFQLIKERIEMGAQACPSWMRSFERGQAGESKK